MNGKSAWSFVDSLVCLIMTNLLTHFLAGCCPCFLRNKLSWNLRLQTKRIQEAQGPSTKCAWSMVLVMATQGNKRLKTVPRAAACFWCTREDGIREPENFGTRMGGGGTWNRNSINIQPDLIMSSLSFICSIRSNHLNYYFQNKRATTLCLYGSYITIVWIMSVLICWKYLN